MAELPQDQGDGNPDGYGGDGVCGGAERGNSLDLEIDAQIFTITQVILSIKQKLNTQLVL